MRTAFVCLFSAAPPTGGAGQVSCALAAALPGERLLLQPGPCERRFFTDAGLPVWQLRMRSGSRWDKLFGMAGYIRRVERALRDWGATAVVLEGASWVFYHWWLLAHLRRRLPHLRVFYHAHNVEFLLRRQRHGWLIVFLTRRAEARVLRDCREAFAVSPVDQAAFTSLYGITPRLLPNGVDARRLAAADATAVARLRQTHRLGTAAILFLGDYAYPPNREAIDCLVTVVMPLVLARCPDACLAISGGAVPYQRPWLRAPGLLPQAQVPAFIRACAVSVAPIFSGSGTRLKILESLAAGVPVVATPKGAEGLALLPGRDFLLATTGAAFADALVMLLGDPARRASCAAAGQRRVLDDYDWARLVPILTAALGGTAPASDGAPPC